MTTVLAIIYLVCLPFTVFFVRACLDYLPYTHKIHSLVLFISVWIVLPLFPIYLINQIHKIQITMRYFFDRDGNYAGSSMQGWEILLLLLFPVALIIFLVFLPFYVFHKYSSREEDKKYEEEHPEILKVDSYITCWYPWHRYSVAYTLALIFWVIAFIIGILS